MKSDVSKEPAVIRRGDRTFILARTDNLPPVGERLIDFLDGAVADPTSSHGQPPKATSADVKARELARQVLRCLSPELTRRELWRLALECLLELEVRGMSRWVFSAPEVDRISNALNRIKAWKNVAPFVRDSAGNPSYTTIALSSNATLTCQLGERFVVSLSEPEAPGHLYRFAIPPEIGLVDDIEANGRELTFTALEAGTSEIDFWLVGPGESLKEATVCMRLTVQAVEVDRSSADGRANPI
jgi:hypothetical protein